MSIHARGTDPHQPLDAVLRAATVPGHPEELAGEEKAMAAFRAAVPAPRRSLFARVLTVKVLVIGAVATSTGVVLAAAGGVIPILREPTVVETPAPPPTNNPAEVDSPPGVDETTSEAPVTTSTTGEPPTQSDVPNQPDPGKGGKGDKDGKERDGRPGGGYGSPSSSTSPPTGEETEEETQTSGPPTSRAETPDSTAHGAVTAVPPNGAEPPSSGG
jgi:hypothetical protein